MTCPTCNGRGKVWHDGITAQFFERCDRCNGTGEIVLRPAAAVPSPEVIRAMGYITDWMEACLRDGKLGGTLTASTEVMREYLNELETTR